MKQHEFLKKENSYYYWYFKKFWKLLLTNIKDPGQTIEIRKTHQTMTISLLIDTTLKVSDELKLWIFYMHKFLTHLPKVKKIISSQ